MNNVFATYHPFTVFFYFICTIFVSLFIRNPIMLALGLVFSAGLYLDFRGIRGTRVVLGLLIFASIFAFAYALFDTRGDTVLFTYFGGRHYTLQALHFGFSIAVVVLIFVFLISVFNRYLTIEKFLFLFGGLGPSATLFLSRLSRFVPTYQREVMRKYEAQVCMGKGARNGVIARHFKGMGTVFSELYKWVATGKGISATAMKSRGFGSAKRTTFTRYEFRPHDLIVVVLTVVCLGCIFGALIFGARTVYYFPHFVLPPFSARAIVAICAYGLLLCIPLVINLKGRLVWRISVSKI